MKKVLLGAAVFAVLVAAGVLALGKESVPVEAGKGEGANGPPNRSTGDVTAVAGSTEFELMFDAYKVGKDQVKGEVHYSRAGLVFWGEVNECYSRDGNEAIFAGTVTNGWLRTYFIVEVQDNGDDGVVPDRVRIWGSDVTPSCTLSGSFPGEVIEGDIMIYGQEEPSDEDTCATIMDGVIEYGRVGDSDETIIPIGYDEWGYNYQAHMYNGYLDNYQRPDELVDEGPWLQMKWSDEWLSNKDCNHDGKLDRGYSCDSVNASSSGCPGAWLTNHERGTYMEGGKECEYNYFVKIVTPGEGAVEKCKAWEGIEGESDCVSWDWYTNEEEIIGESIWGAFAIVQEVYDDSCTGEHGLSYKSDVSPGLGFYTPHAIPTP
jgi:hypothetical protein